MMSRWRRPLALLLSAIMLAGMLVASPSLTFAESSTEDSSWEEIAYAFEIDDPTAPYFQMLIETPADAISFKLPTNSYLNDSYDGKPYSWQIDWGDEVIQVSTGFSSENGGITHLYHHAGSYVITITPSGSTEAWLAAFGFGVSWFNDDIHFNHSMVKAILSPIRPEMTRSQAQIDGRSPAPSYEWANGFTYCSGLIQAPVFTGWGGVKSVGDYFAYRMFNFCGSLKSLPDGFTLPPDLLYVGSNFADSMFNYCWSLESLPTGFNLPQGLSWVGNGFAQWMFYNCNKLNNLPDGFNLPPGITEVGDYFAHQMFDDCWALTALPDGFNLPQGLTRVGDNFADAMFYYCNSLEYLPEGFTYPPGIIEVGDAFAFGLLGSCTSLVSLPEGFNLPQGITTAGHSFARSLFRDCPILRELPEGFNLPPDLTTVDWCFVADMFAGCMSLQRLPDGFNLPQGITSIGDYFAMEMFLYCYDLERLPEGFNLPPSITTAQEYFSFSMFAYCDSLEGLPEGFNLPQGVTTAGLAFAYGLLGECPRLAGLPDGFNLPQGIEQAGGSFAAFLLYHSGNPTFQINEGFSFPAGIPAYTDGAYYNALWLSVIAPAQNRTAASIIGDCPTPATPRYCFSNHYSDIDYIAVNWGGGGLTPPSVGAPGSGDLNGDGFVTMDEVLICARAALDDIGLNPSQLAAIDMDRDGVITMADVMLIYRVSVG